MRLSTVVAVAVLSAGALLLFWGKGADPVVEADKAISAERLKAENEQRTRQIEAKRKADDEAKKKRIDRAEAGLERLEKEGISRDDVKAALEDEIVEELDLDDLCREQMSGQDTGEMER